MPLDPKLNIVMTQTTLGIKQYQEYMIEKERKEKDINIFETHTIPEDYMDDKEDDNLSLQPTDPVQPLDTLRISPKDEENEENTMTLNLQVMKD